VSQSLNGLQVLVTRPEHQAENLSRLIEQHGGIPIRFPTLQIIGVDDRSKATNVITSLSNYQWLIFTSVNAVNFALKAIGGKISQFGALQIAAIGQATALALASAGINVSLLPKRGFDSESLLATPSMQEVNDKAVMIVRGQGGREELASVLRSRGANVEYWEVYKRTLPDYDKSFVARVFEQASLDVVIITSCEALQNLAMLVGSEYKQRLALVKLVVISDRIGKLAAEMGFKRITVTEGPSDQAIIDALIAV
jgi:uroporphyrinogen-III synthase